MQQQKQLNSILQVTQPEQVTDLLTYLTSNNLDLFVIDGYDICDLQPEQQEQYCVSDLTDCFYYFDINNNLVVLNVDQKLKAYDELLEYVNR